MSEQERNNPPTPEELKAAEERRQKEYDDALVARYRHYRELAFRMIVGELEKPTPGHPVSLPQKYDERELRHLAEMLFLLDISRGGNSFTRFRSRYAGNYSEWGL
jgi:hypothetical protein